MNIVNKKRDRDVINIMNDKRKKQNTKKENEYRE